MSKWHRVNLIDMLNLKARLLEELQKIDGIEDRPSPVSGGSALFYKGKEFAHFHNANELDLRLTSKVIKAQGLSHPEDSLHHPSRSRNSPWIELRFTTTNDMKKLAALVKLAVAEL
ncbi:MAG: luciferase family protein [Arenimonas sp.]